MLGDAVLKSVVAALVLLLVGAFLLFVKDFLVRHEWIDPFEYEFCESAAASELESEESMYKFRVNFLSGSSVDITAVDYVLEDGFFWFEDENWSDAHVFSAAVIHSIIRVQQ